MSVSGSETIGVKEPRQAKLVPYDKCIEKRGLLSIDKATKKKIGKSVVLFGGGVIFSAVVYTALDTDNPSVPILQDVKSDTANEVNKAKRFPETWLVTSNGTQLHVACRLPDRNDKEIQNEKDWVKHLRDTDGPTFAYNSSPANGPANSDPVVTVSRGTIRRDARGQAVEALKDETYHLNAKAHFDAFVIEAALFCPKEAATASTAATPVVPAAPAPAPTAPRP